MPSSLHTERCPRFCEVPALGITVVKGPVLDGAGRRSEDLIKVDPSKEIDVAKLLSRTGCEIVVCLLPTGCTKATEYYASCAAEAGCAFVKLHAIEDCRDEDVGRCVRVASPFPWWATT
jgi:myo-inositol-1-phosphate synthase